MELKETIQQDYYIMVKQTKDLLIKKAPIQFNQFNQVIFLQRMKKIKIEIISLQK